MKDRRHMQRQQRGLRLTRRMIDFFFSPSVRLSCLVVVHAVARILGASLPLRRSENEIVIFSSCLQICLVVSSLAFTVLSFFFFQQM